MTADFMFSCTIAMRHFGRLDTAARREVLVGDPAEALREDHGDSRTTCFVALLRKTIRDELLHRLHVEVTVTEEIADPEADRAVKVRWPSISARLPGRTKRTLA